MWLGLLCVLGFACFRNGGLVGLVVAAFVSLLLVCVVWCFLGYVIVVIAACVYCLFVIAVITVNSVVVLRSFYLELTFVLFAGLMLRSAWWLFVVVLFGFAVVSVVLLMLCLFVVLRVGWGLVIMRD